MVAWMLPPELTAWIAPLAALLHGRCAWRLLPLMAGMLFAHGRQTVACWLRAGSLGHDYQDYYYFLGSLGRKVNWLAGLLLAQAVRVIRPGERLLFAIDDTPTKRYGPHVQGAGIHHNPTPGPAGQRFLYGHVWVTLAWVLRHPLWDTIGLPLRAFLYVRQKDVAAIPRRWGVRFQTKLEQAAAMVEWLADSLRRLGQPIWVVVDGAYAKKPFLSRAQRAGVIVVSRLRHDAALWSVPTPVPPGQRRRGRPRIYGPDKLSLARRAAHRGGWQRATFRLYGEDVVKEYKTFLATYPPAGGLIRGVLVRDEDRSWRAYFCTEASATVAQILEAVADRFAIEQDFHDLKEVHGAGEQQVRHYGANVAVYHLTLWWHTLIELWAWSRPKEQLCDRRARPWDDADRRPSHADRRNALRRECLELEFRHEAAQAGIGGQFRDLWNRLLNLVAGH
jgi:hypothetical protein